MGVGSSLLPRHAQRSPGVLLFTVVGDVAPLAFLLVALLPFADLAFVGLRTIKVGEDQIENVGVPFHGVTSDTVLDVL